MAEALNALFTITKGANSAQIRYYRAPLIHNVMYDTVELLDDTGLEANSVEELLNEIPELQGVSHAAVVAMGISNFYKKTSSNYVPLSLTTDLLDVTQEEGTPLDLQVAITGGTPPYGYAWQRLRDGVANQEWGGNQAQGALTPHLHIEHPTPSDSGLYWCYMGDASKDNINSKRVRVQINPKANPSSGGNP